MTRFSIITPSFRQPEWLRLCAASIADQQGVEVEHIIQDAGTEGIADCGLRIAESAGATPTAAQMGETFCAGKNGYTLRLISEKDAGMYDAVNRGLRRASGEICAYLNCDEQYLPGALAAVARFFEQHPEIDVVFGDALVVGTDGAYVCSRQVVVPDRFHTRVCSLGTFTAATFFRRSVIEQRQIFFPDDWRVIGDAVWILELLRQRVPMATLGAFTSTFTDTGDNLCLHPSGLREGERLRSTAPGWARKLAPLWTALFRLRKMFAGHYRPRPLTYSIFTADSPDRRREFVVSKPTFLWASRLNGVGQHAG